MNTNNTRRKLLKFMSASTVLGSMNTAKASSKEGQVSGSETVTSTSTTAISVTNNSTSTEEVEITLIDLTREMIEVQLLTSVEPNAHVTFGTDKIAVTGGTYEVEVKVTDRNADASTTWKLPSGGVPEWRRISAHIKPDSSVKIYNEEE